MSEQPDNDSPKKRVKSSQRTLESIQESFIRRFMRSTKPASPVIFEFTSDKALLHQYYRLRDQVFGRDIGASDNQGGADLYDKISEILVARRGNVVIGACRLTLREGDESFPLPMESETFKLRQLFPDLPLNRERHGVLSKFAILEEHNQRDILYGLCQVMYDRVIALDIHYLFARATNYSLARNWRLIANSFGAKHTTICENIDVPDNPNFPGEKQYITFSDLSDICQQQHPRVPVPTRRKIELVETESM